MEKCTYTFALPFARFCDDHFPVSLGSARTLWMIPSVFSKGCWIDNKLFSEYTAFWRGLLPQNRQIVWWENRKICQGREAGVPKRTEHGNLPIVSTEFGIFLHILTNFENRNTGGQEISHFDRYLTIDKFLIWNNWNESRKSHPLGHSFSKIFHWIMSLSK